jgi:hypothetical protein
MVLLVLHARSASSYHSLCQDGWHLGFSTGMAASHIRAFEGCLGVRLCTRQKRGHGLCSKRPIFDHAAFNIVHNNMYVSTPLVNRSTFSHGSIYITIIAMPGASIEVDVLYQVEMREEGQDMWRRFPMNEVSFCLASSIEIIMHAFASSPLHSPSRSTLTLTLIILTLTLTPYFNHRGSRKSLHYFHKQKLCRKWCH